MLTNKLGAADTVYDGGICRKSPPSVPVRGTQTVKKRLADGTVKIYTYQRGGPSRKQAYKDRVYLVRVAYALDGIVAQIRSRAKKRGIPCDLTRDHIQAMIERQHGRCAVTGLEFDVELPCNRTMHMKPLRPSIDRIEPAKGYIVENCRIVCFALNAAFGQWGEDVFWKIAEAALAKRKAA